MISQHLLYFSALAVSVWRWQRGSLSLEARFQSNESGLRDFEGYLQSNQRAQFALLANLPDEGQAIEIIPFLRGSDRKTLISRRLGQHFLGTPLTCAISLGFEKTLRKNERVLLCALTNPSSIEPWLNQLQNAEISLSGVYSITQLGATLLKRAGLPDKRCLLLSVQDQTIRESYILDGQVHFSRLASLNDDSPMGIANAFATEAGKLHQYLLGQRLAARDETLTVYALTPHEHLAQIAQACPNRGPLHFSFVDLDIVAQKIGIRASGASHTGENLYLHLLASAPPRHQFADEHHRHHFFISRLQRGLLIAGTVALVCGMLIGGKSLIQTRQLNTETARLTASSGDMDRRYQAMTASFPQVGMDANTLRRLTDGFLTFSRQQRQPDKLWLDLGRVMNRMPEIMIDGLDWKNGAFFGSPAAPAFPEHQLAIVRGTIRLDHPDQRQTLETFDRFVEALGAIPGLTVKILQRPIDIESGNALRGGDAMDDELRLRPFALEIARKESP